MKRDLYYVYRLGCDRVITDANIYAKTLCTAFEIRKYLDFLNATDKFGYTYVARKISAYISTDGIKIKGDNMIIGISMLKLLDAFTSLSFGIYLVEIRRGEEKTFWHVAYTDYDGIIITASEIIDAEDVFDYTIYTDSFIEDAINSHNKELESQL